MEEGGSPVRRRRQPPPQQMQQMQQDYYPGNYMQEQQQPLPPPPVPKITGGSSFKSRFSENSKDSTKYAILVVVIFILLNSKLVWSQIMKFPGMGSMEPSIIALIVNGLLAGMAFFVIHSFLMK